MARPLNVLLIEDNADDAELVLHELRRSGYQPTHERVWTAESMAAALQRQAWDAIISDHNMPQFDSTLAMNLIVNGRDVLLLVNDSGAGMTDEVKAYVFEPLSEVA